MPNPLKIDSRRPAGSGPPRKRRRARLVLAGALCLLGPAVDATPFDTLDAQQRQEVADRCLPYRYGDAGAGVEAVRDCLVRGSTAVTGAELSLDERHALRRLCGTDADCAARERQALASTDPVALETLAIDERDTVQRACREVQDDDGPVAWTGCLQETVAALEQGPPLDRRALSFASRRAALSVCTDREPSTYRRCLQEAGMPVGLPRTAAPVASTTADGATAPGGAGPESVPDDGTASIGGGPDGAAAHAPAAEPGLRARLQNSFDALDDTGRLLLLAAALMPLLLWLTRRLTDRRRPAHHGDEEEDGHALPSGGARHAHDGFDRFDVDPVEASRDSALREVPPDQRLPDPLRPTASDPFADRSRLEHEADRLFEDLTPTTGPGAGAPPATTRETRPAPAPPERDPFPAHEPTVQVSRHDGLELMSDGRMTASRDGSDDDGEPVADGAARPPTVPDHGMPEDVVDRVIDTKADAVEQVESIAVHGEAHPMHDDAHPTPFPHEEASVSAFGRWLHEQPVDERLVHVVEFFVYWVAYGDKRYDDAARRALLDDDPAGDDDGPVRSERAIKRWVLLEDTGAFVDAVRWMAASGDAAQRRQTLELLIALLVADAVPTPVQNTLLRFLADAFDIGEKGLQALWAESFGTALPPLPRVDRADWWALQDERDLSERDARRVAGYPAAPRHAARLGLPLRGPYEAARIRAASRLAIQRTEPERFEGLGERAQALAARQLERVEQARDALLEESIA